MNIGLIDVDSHNFPNLCLMKLSAYHKNKGDQVEWWNGLLHYDRVYQSKVFDETYTKDIDWVINTDQVIKGGSGYNLNDVLSDEIEHIYPDYSLYGIKNKAYGFLTRGCPRHCPFCIVGDKEGLISHQVASLDEFWRGQREIILLDPNITASKECERLFDDLIATNSWIEFNQGLDVRLLTDKECDQLNQMKIKMIHFAWDNYEMRTFEKLREIRPLINKRSRETRVYVLTNFNTTHEQDVERVYKLRELDYDPYVMIYDKPNAPTITKRLQRWVNNKHIFYSSNSFEDYR